MTLRAWLNLGAVAAIAALVVAIYWKGRSHGVETERHKTKAAQAQVEAATIKAELARRAAARAQSVVRRQAESADLARQHSINALKAEDAHEPLDAQRTARLLDADRKLCKLAAELDGCASRP